MSREHKDYWNTMERVQKRFGDKELLSVVDAVSFTGLSASTIRRRFSFNRGKIARSTFVREFCHQYGG